MSTFFGAIDVEMPKFELIKKTPAYEIRKYAPQVRAETVFESNDSFGSGGFWPIANYIFGQNRSRSEVAMTAPVLSKSEKATKIAMTAPVISAQEEGGGDVRKHRMSFVMPSKFASVADLPVPLDSKVELVEVPEHTVAVIQFSGFLSDAALKAKESELRLACEKDGVLLDPDAGKVCGAGYNPPMTIPFLRRNEVWIPVQSQGTKSNL